MKYITYIASLIMLSIVFMFIGSIVGVRQAEEIIGNSIVNLQLLKDECESKNHQCELVYAFIPR